jgi:competence protein ComEC
LDQGKGTRNVNDESLVLHARYGDTNFVFCGDIESPAEAQLSPLLPKANVIKVPHHGSKTSSTAALLSAIEPNWSVFSAGRDNQFGHPHADVWERYRRTTRLLTATDGDVHFTSDGKRLTLR